MRDFRRIILYITISFLILTGSFLCFSKTVNANNRVYVYNYSSNDENLQRMMDDYIEYEKQKEEEEKQKAEEKKQAEEKAKSNKPKPGDFASLFGVFVVLALFVNKFFKYLKNTPIESYPVDTDTSSDDDRFTYEPLKKVDNNQNSEEESDLVDVRIEPEEYEISLEPEEYEISLEPEQPEVTNESEQAEETGELEHLEVTNESEQVEETSEVEQLEVTNEPEKIEVISEAVKPEDKIELEQLKPEETIKELSTQELKVIVKNLDSAEKNKFMEPAKNGKKEEAIQICKEVTGLDLINAEKIINLKLYY